MVGHLGWAPTQADTPIRPLFACFAGRYDSTAEIRVGFTGFVATGDILISLPAGVGLPSFSYGMYKGVGTADGVARVPKKFNYLERVGSMNSSRITQCNDHLSNSRNGGHTHWEHG